MDIFSDDIIHWDIFIAHRWRPFLRWQLIPEWWSASWFHGYLESLLSNNVLFYILFAVIHIELVDLVSFSELITCVFIFPIDNVSWIREFVILPKPPLGYDTRKREGRQSSLLSSVVVIRHKCSDTFIDAQLNVTLLWLRQMQTLSERAAALNLLNHMHNGPAAVLKGISNNTAMYV